MDLHIDILELADEPKNHSNELIRKAIEARNRGYQVFNIWIKITPKFSKMLYRHITFKQTLYTLYKFKSKMEHIPEELGKEVYIRNC